MQRTRSEYTSGPLSRSRETSKLSARSEKYGCRNTVSTVWSISPASNGSSVPTRTNRSFAGNINSSLVTTQCPAVRIQMGATILPPQWNSLLWKITAWYGALTTEITSPPTI
uniref:Uncharacterized protein n=1 Tax=Anopheles atroparvus TaxID=41427 RepID=A0AAG5D9Q2_ANOAO